MSRDTSTKLTPPVTRAITTMVSAGSQVGTSTSGSTPTGESTCHHLPASMSLTTPEDSATQAPSDQCTGLTRPIEPPTGWLELRVWAEMFDDAQKARIAASNRAERGGVAVDSYLAQIALLKHAEHQTGLAMRRHYRRIVPAPIIEWQKDTPGIGEHLLARLLGIVGHPVHTRRHKWEGTGSDRVLVDLGPMDRRVSDLWSYCGHGDPKRKRAKGMSADDAARLGSPRAKTLVHLLAEACVKQRTSPYRVVYDDAREKYLERDWTDGHRHAAAMRLMGKEILKDLWRAAGGT